MTETLAKMMEEIDSPINFSHRGKLCLNMIVKNESRIIERLLDSVKGIVDTYCIYDTGSTDDTVERIEAYMKTAGIPGEVCREPFQNFGYNRTVALEKASQWGEYALLLDADMRLVVEPEFSKDALREAGYSILQKNGSLVYSNMRIVRTGIGVRCVGPTHEYYDFPSGAGETKTLASLWIDDIGDGGAKADKFLRDIRLLEDGLKAEPGNGRYMYYLGNSYKNVGNYPEAIAYYKKRIAAGGWMEEIFYSCYEIGCCYKELNNMAEAVHWWLEAYNRHPKRSESLYEITKYYREAGKQKTAQIFCDLGLQIPYPKDDVLFIRKDVYEHLFHYEHSILAFYTGSLVNHRKYLELIGIESLRNNVLSNYKFYVKKLSAIGGVDYVFDGKAEKLVGGRLDSFTSSSPCIVPCGEGYMLNVRYVNYTIRGDGSYAFRHDDGKITTLQRVYWLNRDCSIVRSTWIDDVQDPELRYQGVEDVKIFSHCGDYLFLGTVEHPEKGDICVGKGVFDWNKPCLQSVALRSPFANRCEKNWCMFHTFSGEMKVVYSWSPLRIGVLEGDGLVGLSEDTGVPDFFRDLRGSSNGCLNGDEVWFLCHLVEYSTPRHYYHILVVLDARTLKFVRHSILFKFHSDCIEYALGLIVEVDRVLMSYSRMDRTSAVLTLDRGIVERELFM
jgi:glycosyltransferase involved in cell wall biosynthesis